MQQEKKTKVSIIVEDVIILLSIAVLWLTIFRLEGRIYDVIKYLTLAVLVVIFIRRFARVRQFW